MVAWANRVLETQSPITSEFDMGGRVWLRTGLAVFAVAVTLSAQGCGGAQTRTSGSTRTPPPVGTYMAAVEAACRMFEVNRSGEVGGDFY
jgi:hypothetical protein